MKSTTRLLVIAATAAAFTIPLTAQAVQQAPPQCTIERSGPLSVTGTCPTGFYWVTAHCQDRFSGTPEWVKHSWGDAKKYESLRTSCAWHETLRGGDVFNATTGEKQTIRL